MELIITGILEVLWLTVIKWSDGSSKISYPFYTVIGMVTSFYFLSKAIKSLPMSLSYPVWTGISAVSSVVVGVVLFHDELNLSTWSSVGVPFISIIGIRITNGH